MFGLNYIVFRPHNVYGETKILAIVTATSSHFHEQIMQGQPMTIFGDGGQTRAFSYMMTWLRHRREQRAVRTVTTKVFNVGADKPYSVNELRHRRCPGDGRKIADQTSRRAQRKSSMPIFRPPRKKIAEKPHFAHLEFFKKKNFFGFFRSGRRGGRSPGSNWGPGRGQKKKKKKKSGPPAPATQEGGARGSSSTLIIGHSHYSYIAPLSHILYIL